MLTHTDVVGCRRYGGWLLLATLFCMPAAALAQGVDVLLNWDPSPDPEVRGYGLSVKQADGRFGDPVDLGFRSVHALIGLAHGRHSFRLTALTPSGPSDNYARDFSVSIGAPKSGREAMLAWDPIPGRNIAGYRIHVGHSPGAYTSQEDVGTATNYSLSRLDPGTYFFAIQAYGPAGDLSGLSQEVSATVFSEGSALSPCPSKCAECSGCDAACGSGNTGSGPLDISYPGRNPVDALEGRLTVTNLGSEAAEVTWEPMRADAPADGSSRQSRTLEPGAQLSVLEKDSPPGWVRVQSPSSHIVGSLTVFDPAYARLDALGVAPLPAGAFVFPEVRTWDASRFSISNPGDGAITLTMDLRGKDGDVKSEIVQEIPAGGALENGSPLDLFPNSPAGASDYLSGHSTGPVSAFEFEGKIRKTLCAFRGLAESDAGTTLVSPQYVVGGGWVSQLSAVNLDPVSGVVSVEFLGENGARIGSVGSLAVPPNGKLQFSGGELFGVPSGEFRQGYLVIRSSGIRMAGSVIFSDSAQERFSAALPLIAHPERSQVINQFASTDEYFTGLSILNPGEKDSTMKLELYNQEGGLEVVMVVGIKAGRRRTGLLTEFFPNLAGVNRTSGYIRICSEQPVACHVLFGSRDLSFLSAIPSQTAQ